MEPGGEIWRVDTSYEQELKPRVEIFSSRVAGEDCAPIKICPYFWKLLLETNRTRKLIFGQQVNIDKANSRRYNIIR